MTTLCVTYNKIVNDGQLCYTVETSDDDFLVRLNVRYDSTVFLSKRCIARLHSNAIEDKKLAECEIKKRRLYCTEVRLTDDDEDSYAEDFFIYLSAEILAEMYEELIN